MGPASHRLTVWPLLLASGCVLLSCVSGVQTSHRARVVGFVPSRAIDTKLFAAIRKNDVKAAKLLLELGANPNAIESNDWPAIVEAAQESAAMVKLLLARGARINARQSDQGWTPLTIAITSGRTDVALYLLAHGADPTLAMSDAATPLHMAVRFGDAKVVEALLRRKVNVNARTQEEPNLVHSRHADEQTSGAFEPGYRYAGRTPLFELVEGWQAHPQIAKLLLDSGADVKATDVNGWTLLHVAAKYGSVSAAKQLLKLGLDPNARSRQGFTPLHVAVRAGIGVPVVAVIKALLEAGADPQAKNNERQTPEDLLRADGTRLLASTQLSPATLVGSPSTRQVLKVINEGLQALHPGAESLAFPVAPVADGWSMYPPLKLDLFGDDAANVIERKVKSVAGGTHLALTYRQGKEGPTSLRVDELELNTYESLKNVPLVLAANRQHVVDFPSVAGPLGGSVWMKFSFGNGNASGGGSVGEAFGAPNPGFVQDDTPKGRAFAVYCDEVSRSVEFRVDKLTVGGKELVGYRGKLLLVQPSSGEPDPASGLIHSGTPLITLKKGSAGFPKLGIQYSFRLVGNRRWRVGNIDL